jgi:hypothetical protein
MTLLTSELDKTVAACWRGQLKGRQDEDDVLGKTHWRTKVSYYRAMEKFLLDDHAAPLTWQEVVDRVEPKGSRTTFYLVAGTNAAHPLLRDYGSDLGGAGEQIAALYTRGSAVQKLLDEMKVWSYWAHRTGWLTQLRLTPDVSRRQAAECMVRVLTDWAVTHPETARALDHAPPMAAVEDLLVVWNRTAGAAPTAELLRDVLVCALGPLGTTSDGVLRAVRSRLDPLAQRGNPDLDGLLCTLAETSFGVIREIAAMPGSIRAQARDAAVMAMEDAVAELSELG